MRWLTPYRSRIALVLLSFASAAVAVLPTLPVSAQAQLPTPTGVVTPVVACREERAGGSFVWFGYVNDAPETLTIALSPEENKFTPAPQDRGQPTVFIPGPVERAVLVELRNSGNHTWHLRSPNGVLRTATASSSTPLCPPMPPVGAPADLAARCAEPYAIWGTTGDDKIAGTSAADVICSFSGDDVIIGADGDDLILAGAGNDYVLGAEGADRIDAGPGDDSVNAGDGADVVGGGDGVDAIAGNAGNDTIDGQGDDDLIIVGVGVDVANGGPGSDRCTEAETVVACEDPTSLDDALPQLAFRETAPTDGRVSVEAVAPTRIPDQRLLVSVNSAWTFTSSFVATPAVDVSFSSDAQPLSASITLPTVAVLAPDEPLTVALVDPESQLLVPVETAIERLPGALRFAAPHFSTYLVIRGRASDGEWSSPILDGLYGDMPAKCLPLGSVEGSALRTSFVVAVDTSGSLLEAEAGTGPRLLDVRRQWLSKFRINDLNRLDVTTFDGDVYPEVLQPVFPTPFETQRSRSEQQLGGIVLPQFGDSDIRAAFDDGLSRLSAAAGQKALIIVTDDDGAGRLNESDAAALADSGVYLFLVRVGTPNSLPPTVMSSSRFVTEYPREFGRRRLPHYPEVGHHKAGNQPDWREPTAIATGSATAKRGTGISSPVRSGLVSAMTLRFR